MPDTKVSITVRNPARPVSGTGDIIVPFGDTDQSVVLSWKDGEIVDIFPAKGNTVKLLISGQITESEHTGGASPQATTCKKCAKDSASGNEVCWPVACLV